MGYYFRNEFGNFFEVLSSSLGRKVCLSFFVVVVVRAVWRGYFARPRCARACVPIDARARRVDLIGERQKKRSVENGRIW